MTGRNAFYITTAISYVNGEPHLGHAYEAIATDVLARFQRLDGRKVMFLTGTDEHGQKVEKAARAAGVDPQTFCDRVSQSFRDMTRMLNISNDDFIRTTEPRHIAASQGIWRALADAGEIYLGKYAGWYAVRDEAFYNEDELTEGPDGTRRAPTGAPVEWVEEPSYFFRLSAWQDRLLAFYEANPDFILPPSRRNEVVSFVRSGLKDLSVSRTSFNWGVPVPGDPDHIMYVWLDALTNYITAVGYPDVDDPKFRTFWPADLHIVGKDIVRFHAVYWPAFLMAAGLEPPKRVFGHGFLNIEGEKMSKSLGNVLSPSALVAEFGLDQIRYFLMREVPFGNDGSFSREGIVNRINSDLANDFGNLAQRVLSMIARNCGGRVPEPGALAAEDRGLLTAARNLVDAMRAEIAVQAIHLALARLFEVVGEANRYVDSQAPWVLRKSDPARMATVLYVLADTIRQLAILAQPVMPGAMGRMLDQLAVPADRRRFADLGEGGALVPGTALPQPQGVFPRYAADEQRAV